VPLIIDEAPLAKRRTEPGAIVSVTPLFTVTLFWKTKLPSRVVLVVIIAGIAYFEKANVTLLGVVGFQPRL